MPRAARGTAARLLAPLALLGAFTACRDASTAPAAPPAGAALDSTGLITAAKVAALPAEQRAAWTAYVARSRQRMAADRALVLGELAAAGRTAVLRPPNTAADFASSPSWTATWYSSAQGLAMTEAILSFQTASGGWGKHIDYAQGPRRPGMGYNSESDAWDYVGTIDNGATVNELQFLVAAYNTTGNPRASAAVLRGLEWLYDAQFPNGCWPQVWPLMGGYHDAATFNDDATTNVLRFLRTVAAGSVALVPAEGRARAADALARGLGCLVASQVRVNGTLTAWGQQHDPVTLQPTLGRSYELPGLSGREGSNVLRVLMEQPGPTPAMIAAVHAGAAWYRATAIPNFTYDQSTGPVAKPGAGPIWARIAEIGTNRPIFANRDGVLLYDFDRLTDRRTGYSWFGTEPATALRTYDVWALTYPRP